MAVFLCLFYVVQRTLGVKSMLKGYIRGAKSVKQQETPSVIFGLVVADQADVGFTWGKIIAYPQR